MNHPKQKSEEPPEWISLDRWDAMESSEKQVEYIAKSIVDRQLLTHDTLLIWECVQAGVMQMSDVANYPKPNEWSIQQCREWYITHETDFLSLIPKMDRCGLTLYHFELISFGLEEIPEDVLRSVLTKLATDDGEHGLVFWRELVASAQPDIYEWWGVEESLGEELVELNYTVLSNDFGCWWGRQATGASILLDGVFQGVARKRLSHESLQGNSDNTD